MNNEPVLLDIRNESDRKRLFTKKDLGALANLIYATEGHAEPVMVSLLFCDDPFIAELNETYRHTQGPTDVLSFNQPEGMPVIPGEPALLGDIVISLETVERYCREKQLEPLPAAMKQEIRFLLCHGMLHLLGYDHETKRDKAAMIARQMEYLRVSAAEAWHE